MKNNSSRTVLMLSVPLLILLGVILVPMIKRSAANHPAPQKPEQITEEVSVPVIEIIPAEALEVVTNQVSASVEVDPTTEAALNNMGFSMSNSVKISVK